MTERRNEFRHSGSGSANIISADCETPIKCTVQDISGSGGCLEVNALVSLPETFRLAPDDNSSLGYPCRVMWRKGNRVGIMFDE
jgi:PilZ domain